MQSLRLNKEQKKAIEYKNGPLLIIAGAGTGKTTVVTQRIKHLIVDKKIDPQNILALTFTEKAAYEMQERVDILLPYGYVDLWINTFHSFCDRILRNEAYNIGLDPNFKLLSESESILLLRQNIFELNLSIFKPLGNPTKFLDALLTHFSRLKDEDVTPDEYISWAIKQKNPEEKRQYLELANAYKNYEEIKTKNSLMDFSDLISSTLLLFRKRRNILSKYQKQFRFILVDEFQDTNFAQNELAILLSGKDKNITVVADDDQSIYRFRGAAVSNVIQFKKKFPKTKVISLIENYRSTQTILNSAYKLIQNNNPTRLEVIEGINKKLKSNLRLKEEKIKFLHLRKNEDEAEEIANKIKKLNKDYDYKDIAILARANNHSQPITAALQRRGIPYQFLGPGYLFQQEEIKDLISYLTFLTDLSDTVSLFRVLSMDVFQIPYVELNYLLNFAKKRNLTLFESFFELNQTFLKNPTREKLEKFKKMVEKHLERSKKDQAGQVLYDFLIDSGLYEKYKTANTQKEEKQVQNISKFFDRIKSFEMERADSNIFILVEWLTLMLQLGESPTAAETDLRSENAVNILTVHSSKGLEFRVVFMINLVSDRFPSRERAEKIPLPHGIIKENLPENIDFHLEEERRLFYVGMTRAKELLYLTAADLYGGLKRPKKISNFVYEALPELKVEEIKNEPKQLTLSQVLSSYEKKEEQKENKLKYKVDYITYSNLQMFDICPLHYKAKVIFRIPTPPTGVQSFGISLHKTLQNFYQQVKDGNKLGEADLQRILKEEWEKEGYQNKKHEEERYLQAKKILNNFYRKEFTLEVLPIALEYEFKFLLKNGVKVFGKIDRIDPAGRGIEIIDYKTGEDNPKASAAHELQLAIYALAATRVKDKILNKHPADITLTLHFLDGNTKKSMKFKKEDLESLENELVKKISEIENSDFKCSGSVLCVNCEFRMLCSHSN